MESTPVPLTPMTPGKFEALFEMPPQAEEMDGATALSQLRQHMSSAASAADADADAAVAAAFAFPPGDSSSGAPFADFCLDDVGVSVDELLPPGDFVLQQYAAPPGPADVTAAYASAAYASAAPAALELSMGMDADADADADADDRQLELDMDDALMEELEGYSPHSASASSTGETPVSGRASSAVSSDEGSSGTDAGADASNKPFAKRARQRMAEELTPREIELLRKEGFEMPANRRLTKDQEKQLKKLRRKIKNKMSAQDSRKRKKQEREELEKRIDYYASNNTRLTEKVTNLEKSNRAMATQLRNLRARLAQLLPKGATVGTALMLLGACFTVFTPQAGELGNGLGLFNTDADAPGSGAFCRGDSCVPAAAPSSSFRARTLLSVHDDDVDEDEDDDRKAATVPGSSSGGDAQWTSDSLRKFRSISSRLAQATAATAEGDVGMSLDNSTEDDYAAGDAGAAAVVPQQQWVAPVAVHASAGGAAAAAEHVAA